MAERRLRPAGRVRQDQTRQAFAIAIDQIRIATGPAAELFQPGPCHLLARENRLGCLGRKCRSQEHSVADQINSRVRQEGKNLDPSLLTDAQMRRKGDRLGIAGVTENQSDDGAIAHG